MTTAFTRRQFLAALAGVSAAVVCPSGAWAFGEDDAFSLATLRYASPTWDARSAALDRLLREVEITTSIRVAPRAATVDATSAQLLRYPLLFVTGDRAFAPWSDAQRALLRRYMQAGGLIVFDSHEGRVTGEFRASIEREARVLFPEKTLERTPASHVLYKSFYLCRGDEGRLSIANFTESVEDEGRIRLLVIHNDLQGAWARDPSGDDRYYVPSGDQGRALAYRFGVNLAMYALCLDYKEDQVHVPFLLRRRRWSVP